MNHVVKIVSMDGNSAEIHAEVATLIAHLRHTGVTTGAKSVVVEAGAWRFLATLLGDTSEPLSQQLLDTSI